MHGSTDGRQCPFFFHAEDGIRDIGVTGVQTCALPICWRTISFTTPVTITPGVTYVVATFMANNVYVFTTGDFTAQIGRASCRERVEMLVVEESAHIHGIYERQ